MKELLLALWAAIVGWFSARQQQKAETLERVSKIYRKGIAARGKNDPITDRLYDRDYKPDQRNS